MPNYLLIITFICLMILLYSGHFIKSFTYISRFKCHATLCLSYLYYLYVIDRKQWHERLRKFSKVTYVRGDRARQSDSGAHTHKKMLPQFIHILINSFTYFTIKLGTEAINFTIYNSEAILFHHKAYPSSLRINKHI